MKWKFLSLEILSQRGVEDRACNYDIGSSPLYKYINISEEWSLTSVRIYTNAAKINDTENMFIYS